jgi:hypothetical protein
MSRRPAVGLFAIVVAIAFNVPYAMLAESFAYPDILRKPAGEVLDLFARGGATLVLTWYAFMLSALALVPLALALPITHDRLRTSPALAIGAALAGSLAGLAQAVGLSRWVYAVPEFARLHAHPAAEEASRRAAEQGFALLNAWGGVAIGEALGQLLTAGFVACVAALQWREARRGLAILGGLAALAIALGTGGGLALALGRPDDAFVPASVAGYLGLTAWLIATGIREWRGARALACLTFPLNPLTPSRRSIQ